MERQRRRQMEKSGIHIKKSHQGLLHKDAGKAKGEKFTVAELNRLKHSDDPAVRRRATFAMNARHWNHK